MNTNFHSVCLRRAGLLFSTLLTLASPSAFAQAVRPTPPATDAAKGETVQLTTFTVREDQDIGYESMQTTSGMRTVQELKNVANSISIMNAQLIEDTASLTVDEMSTWFVSGESEPEPNALVEGKVVLRGIQNAFAMRNGWIWYSPMDSYSTERVEILRGPNAFLYGEADVGGAQNQITKRGLFTRDVSRLKLMVGNNELLRAEIDFNRRLIKDKLALRVSAVRHHNESWIDNVRKDFQGIYAAVTFRPFQRTEINVMAEHAETTAVNAQGLWTDAFSRTATAPIAAGGGYVFIPATGLRYRAQGTGRVNSTGSGTTVVDTSIVPRTFHSAGPNSTLENMHQSITLEAEQHIGDNLHLQVTGNFYRRKVDYYGVTGGRTILRDRNATIPGGQANPYFNELYTEYYRTRFLNGNLVRDMRFSAVYDLNTNWMKQQLMVNLQQHQDNPENRKPKWAEYVDHTTAAWNGVQPNPAITQAAYTANRTLFTGNRFMRRYYFNRDGLEGNDSVDPVPGVSAWYPDLSGPVPAAGQQLSRRFYTPSWGVGASGSYFKNHLFTHVGYREDKFNMKTSLGTVRPLQNEWVTDFIPGAFAPNPDFLHVKAEGANYGAILRFNDTFAVGYNYAQSFRISAGEGAQTYNAGERQGIFLGEGEDLSARFSLLQGRIEFNVVRYHNFRPNDRFNPAPVVAIRDEVADIFPDTFIPNGQDYQTTTTEGYEFELMANVTRNWRMTFNLALNEVVTENRAPLLKGFQAEAKEKGQPTPLLDAFLETIPEGVPNPGYTKARANMFTRYTFTQGLLRGAYIGGGVNWRDETFRGNADLDGIAATPVVAMWSPSYYLVSVLAGYRTKIMNRPTTFALNVGNLLDKDYYRSGGIATGSWGEPRSFRFTATAEF